MTVRFLNNNTKYILRNKRIIKDKLKSIATKEGFSIDSINIIFTTDKSLLEINKKFLSKNYLTDIITFDNSQNDFLDGELYISLDRVRENAQIFNISFVNELLRIIIHGFLHLMKYSDKTILQKKEMTNKENLYLRYFKDLL